MGQRLIGPQHLDPRDGAKTVTVIETELGGGAVEFGGIDDAQRRYVFEA